MKKRTLYSISVYSAAALMILSSCAKIEEYAPDVTKKGDDAAKLYSTEFCADCSIAQSGAGKALPTKATGLIDQVTTRQLEANFLRIDEEIGDDNTGLYTFQASTAMANGKTADDVNWEKAYMAQATVISSPDNTEDINYRSIIFSPAQAYNIITKLKDGETDKYDTTKFRHTRMVGWYPQTCALLQTDGTQQFEYSITYDDGNPAHPLQDEYYTSGDRTYKAVKFAGLDGSQDVMVSNVCEGQMWHSKDTGKSKYAGVSDNLPYRVPFGHYQQYHENAGEGEEEFTTLYSNYFKFRHYLSGVRFWGFVPEQNSHSLDMWGKINDVMLLNQPTSVCVSLPEEPVYGTDGNSLSWDAENFTNESQWGVAFGWDDFTNFSVQTGPMFGDDTNHSAENYTVDFSNIDMTGVGDVNSALYLGYSLVRPDHSVEVQIHTKYGVYVTTISNEYTYTPKGSSESTTVDIFKPGYYYDVYLSLETDGTIAALIEDSGTEKYYDLTRNISVDVKGAADDSVSSYKYANSYIVDPAKYDSDNDKVCDYDGFFFSGVVAGNGDGGMLTYNSQTFYPTSTYLEPTYARLIWESSRLLVSNVELVNGYVKFKVPQAKTTLVNGKYTGQTGNAVIGVFDDNDKCLWSWHIWITDTPSDMLYTTSAGNTVAVMDRNLGATYGGVPTSTDNALASYGLYYQWGRKDPSMGPPSYNYAQQDASTSTYYDYASDEYNSVNIKSFSYPSLKDGVENPMYPILPVRKLTKGYSYDWLDYGPANILWGYNHTTNTMTKTIYDPCPFGYRVSAGEVGIILEDATCATNTYGLSYTGDNGIIFFPYAGYKGVDKGISTLTTEWHYPGEKGDYMEAMYNKTSDGGIYHRKRHYISSATSWEEKRAMGVEKYTYGTNIACVDASHTHVFSDWTNRRTAASVRCVKDEEFGGIDLTNSPEKTTFTANEAIEITLSASTSATTLTNVTAYIIHYADGELKQTEIVQATSPGTANWSKTWTFTAPEASYLMTTTGEYTVVLEATNGFGVNAKRFVTLEYENRGQITVNTTKFVKNGSTASLGATSNSDGTLTYSSSDTTIATVDASGNVTGVANGTATITISLAANNGYTAAVATVEITVGDLQAQSFNYTTTSYSGQWDTKYTNTTLTGTTYGDVTYSSNNPTVASVNSTTGEVSLNKPGTAIITATAAGNDTYAEGSASYNIEVTKKTRSITMKAVELELYGNSTTTIAPGEVTLSTDYISSDTDSYHSGTFTFELENSSSTVATLDAATNKLSAGTTRGTVNIRAKVAESEYYFAATSEYVAVKVYAYVIQTSNTFSSTNSTYVIASTGTSGSTANVLTYGDNVSNTSLKTGTDNSKTIIAETVPKTCAMTLTSTSSSIKSYSNNSYYLQYSNGLSWVTSSQSWSLSANNNRCYYKQSSGRNNSSYYYLYHNGSNWTTYKSSSSNSTYYKVYFYLRTCSTN